MILIYFWFFLSSYILLTIYQVYHYEIKYLIKYYLRNFLLLNVPNIIFIFAIFTSKYFNYFATIFIAFNGLIMLKRLKFSLRFTSRSKRMLITYFLLFGMIVYFISIEFFLVLIPFFIIISNYFNKPIEHLINCYYIKKARKKLLNTKATKIAITGSFGKTSTKYYLSELLQNKYIVKKTPKSYNTPLGIAAFVNKNDFSCDDFIVFEFGARRVNDIRTLKKYYPYDIAIVTGITKMHIDTFKKIENIIEEKMSLVDDNVVSILNYENEYIRNYNKKGSYSYGFNYGEYQAKNLNLTIFGSSFDLYIDGIFKKNITIKPLGRGAVLNFLPLIIISDIYNISYDCLKDILMVDNRLSLRKIGDYYILDDAYNSNIIGASYALEVVKSYSGKKFMITPGFFEMDIIKEELCVIYSEKINEAIDHLILIKNDFTEKLSKYITVEMEFADSFTSAFSLFLKMKVNESILLIENDLLE